MELVGNLLIIVGIIAILIGGVWFLIEEFRSGILWLLACIFIPFVSLLWLVTHWEEGKRPFVISTLGAICCIIGAHMNGRL